MASNQRWNDSLMESIIGWSEEFGVDYTAFFSPDGFRFFAWWEKIVSCMTLEEVQVYLDIPELPAAKESLVIQRIRDIAIAHRNRLLRAEGEGEGLHAKTEQCVG